METRRSIRFLSSEFRSISFDNIAKTQYRFAGDVLQAKVKRSASALILPFDQAQQVERIAFEWKHQAGEIRWQTPQQQKEKEGDDAYWRIGLILEGKAPMIPFFAPAWIKQVLSIVKLESNRMLYLIVGSPLAAQTQWPSPYSDSISNLALASEDASAKEPWRSAVWQASEALSVVGLWLMADGDNTGSSFQTALRNLRMDVKKKRVGEP